VSKRGLDTERFNVKKLNEVDLREHYLVTIRNRFADIIRQIKSRRMRWAGHVARVGDGKNVYRVLV
jgi:hypothetical protein